MTLIDESVASTDLAEAETVLRRVYPLAEFRESATPFAFAQHVRGDERAVLARFSIDSWADIQVEFTGTVAIGQLISGRYSATSNDEPLDVASPFLFRPGLGASQSEGLDIHMVNLSQGALAEFAGASRGIERARVRTNGTAPVSADRAVTWTKTVEFVRETFENPELLNNELLRRPAVSLLFAAALSCFPMEVTGSETRWEGDALPSAVRRALAHIDEHLAEPIALEDIAAAARLSVRGLQSAFRRYLDSTPTAELRRARLSAVRADLVRSDSSVADVASIAHSWGFQHLGRFAGEYRAAYGELPRRTLER
ncbi:helix-turn-helix transcriptional regulator [Microbacterium sp. SS28]|uniref:helix-turn-helix transcriptional regulator n=1 Tax=Microbacterium sp. SS28 TaxID=2919948 RepID=UPI001FAA4957|nr:helix-turn-helix transcriptional regulator [Microbacterium sp. SS28]